MANEERVRLTEVERDLLRAYLSSCLRDGKPAMLSVRQTHEFIAMLAALPVQVAGKPVAWLRDAQPDAEDEALVVCNRIDAGAFPVFASPPAPASQVLTEEERDLIEHEREEAQRAIDGGRLYEGNRTKRLLSIIDRITNKDAKHG